MTLSTVLWMSGVERFHCGVEQWSLMWSQDQPSARLHHHIHTPVRAGESVKQSAGDNRGEQQTAHWAEEIPWSSAAVIHGTRGRSQQWSGRSQHCHCRGSPTAAWSLVQGERQLCRALEADDIRAGDSTEEWTGMVCNAAKTSDFVLILGFWISKFALLVYANKG